MFRTFGYFIFSYYLKNIHDILSKILRSKNQIPIK